MLTGLRKVPPKRRRSSVFFGLSIRRLQQEVDKQFESEQSRYGCPVRAMARITWNDDGTERLRIALMFDLNAFGSTEKDYVISQIKKWIHCVWDKTLYLSKVVTGSIIVLNEEKSFIGLRAGTADYKEKVEKTLDQLRNLAKRTTTPSGEYQSTFLYRNGRAEWPGLERLRRYYRRRNGSVVSIAPRRY